MNTIRLLCSIGLLAGLVSGERAGAATATEWALRFFGISANPSSMKGPNDDPGPGDIWIADLPEQKPVALTTGGGYRWPVFEPGGGAVIALRGGAVVRVPLAGGPQRVLHPAGRVGKLVGFDRKDGSKVLVLLVADDGSVVPGEFHLATGKASGFQEGRKDLNLMAHLESQQRVYGKAVVFSKAMSDTTISGAQIEWTDVHYADGQSAARNVSRCKPVNCNQPSLSPDGLKVAFIKAGH